MTHPRYELFVSRAGQIRKPALAVLLSIVCGCSMLRPARTTGHFYILTAVASAGPNARASRTSQGGCVVWIRPLELAGYLRTKQMVVRTGTNEIDFALYHQWAEPLDEGIRRVVGQDLQGSPGVQVLSGPPARAASPVYEVSIQVLACEGIRAGQHGSADFAARWEVRSPDGEVKRGRFQMRPAAWDGRDFGQLARGLSQGAEALAKTLFEAISPGAAARSVS